MFNFFEELFAPGRKHAAEEQKRLELTRVDLGVGDPGRGPIDLASGKVIVKASGTGSGPGTDGGTAPEHTAAPEADSGAVPEPEHVTAPETDGAPAPERTAAPETGSGAVRDSDDDIAAPDEGTGIRENIPEEAPGSPAADAPGPRP
ncbi:MULTISPECIES: DUF6191 domain-containing protein [unclassified Streptomyces]|uniref:DUF6191 domain-containing protein n=1 Tax=unclassified Streptomyces TaxID=2593676 RepID=UPI0036E8DE40